MSFPAHLVKKYIDEFNLSNDQTLLDPFAGTGTTLIEAKRRGIKSVGIEANPFAHFASKVKTQWEIDIDDLFITALEIADQARKQIENRVKTSELQRFTPEQDALLIKNTISPLALHKTLLLKKAILNYENRPFYSHLMLALAKSTTFSVSNLRFGPEVGIGKIKEDADVVGPWMREIENITRDIKMVRGRKYATSKTICADSRDIERLLDPASIDAVITSPPYPNEKDYSRTTRLETVLLDFAATRGDLQTLKKNLVRSNTRGIYKEDNDAFWIQKYPEIEEIAKQIEERRIALGKTSGFERLYPKVTREYFGGMARHLDNLKTVLKPGAKLAYVVGDQASYLRVMIRTGHLLATIAESLGYKHVRTDLFRERFASSTKEYLREEVVILKWEGK